LSTTFKFSRPGISKMAALITRENWYLLFMTFYAYPFLF
jgi:hypothetical protein